ncbi:tRNA pseudouridine(13) synthase TruD [Aliikangiella sp. G2MR2-5]|uniref:tRNA pseudouridine(13) synthase TruD n=1 Tax=Aliikangiella sp. G2MR2-5 TaxID=2788943 RepID=UPI0018AC2844|nr:tRNA pseudouridine(13) synthase TruD [Aliikangiella sp. G2MR2-5]
MINDDISFAEHNKSLPRALGLPVSRATIRAENAHFKVNELLSFEPCGEGEHLFLQVKKTGINTDWVAKSIACHFGVSKRDIGYAGKKDRYSESVQWFSVYLPGKEGNLDGFDCDDYQLLKAVRHNKKLKKGAVKCNEFVLRLTDLKGPVDRSSLALIARRGVPNYFGYQRFGHDGNNIDKGLKLIDGLIKVKDRNKKGLYLSAVRSYWFNLFLARRVSLGNWDKALNGDCFGLNNSQSTFKPEVIDDEIRQRLESGDIHTSGWLAGRQPSQASHQAMAIEQEVIDDVESLQKKLAKFRLDSSRRSNRVIPQQLSFEQMDDNQAVLSFKLPGGSFATSVLREIFEINDAANIERNFVKPDSNDNPMESGGES